MARPWYNKGACSEYSYFNLEVGSYANSNRFEELSGQAITTRFWTGVST